MAQFLHRRHTDIRAVSSEEVDADDNNMFKEVLKNAKAAEAKYIGPDYPYYKYIRTPGEIGMSGKGTLKQLGKDVDGLVNYMELLVSGGGKASATGQPLGNRFFLKTGGKCVDAKTGEDQSRYIYINNVPQGNIPLISGGMGVNFSEFKGLIPGTISNLNAFNPMTIFQSFLSGAKPQCQELTMETIDAQNRKSTATHYVTNVDIQNTDPCSFMDHVNPITGAPCRETFSGASEEEDGYNEYNEYKEYLRNDSDDDGANCNNNNDEHVLLCQTVVGIALTYGLYRWLKSSGRV